MLLQIALQLHQDKINAALAKAPDSAQGLSSLREATSLFAGPDARAEVLQTLMSFIPADPALTPWGRAVHSFSPSGRGRSDIILRASLAAAIYHVAHEEPRQSPEIAFAVAEACELQLPEEVFEILVKTHFALHALAPECPAPVFDPLSAFLARRGARAFEGRDQSQHARETLATLKDLDPWRDPEPRFLATSTVQPQPAFRELITMGLPPLLNHTLCARPADIPLLCACVRDLWERLTGEDLPDEGLAMVLLVGVSIRLANSHPKFLLTEHLLSQLPRELTQGVRVLDQTRRFLSPLIAPSLRLPG